MDDNWNDTSDVEDLKFFERTELSNLDRINIKKNAMSNIISISFFDLLLNE